MLKYTMIPFPIKAIKLLIQELHNIKEQDVLLKEEDEYIYEYDDGEWDGEEEMEYEGGGELNGYLGEFFLRYKETSRFAAVYQALTREEQAVFAE